jgi:hypothetical protein
MRKKVLTQIEMAAVSNQEPRRYYTCPMADLVDRTKASLRGDAKGGVVVAPPTLVHVSRAERARHTGVDTPLVRDPDCPHTP